MTTAEGGWGLDGILKNKQHVLNGVVNGIDMLEWDPSTDEHTAASYSLDDLSGQQQLPTSQSFQHQKPLPQQTS